MKPKLSERFKLALLTLTGRAPLLDRFIAAELRAARYQALAMTAYSKLCDFERLKHNGKKASAAARFVETQAKDAGLDLHGF